MSDQGITVCHIQKDAGRVDVHGARHNGGGIETYDVGLKGWLGNPFTLKEFDRRTVVLMYAAAFDVRQQRDPEFRFAIEDLEGKNVGCWCRRWHEDEPLCHLDVVDHYLRGSLNEFVKELAAPLREAEEIDSLAGEG